MIKGYNKISFDRNLESVNEPEWMTNKRVSAWKRYEEIPFPTKKEEEWKRTDLSGLKLDEIYPSQTHAILNNTKGNKDNNESDGVIFTTMDEALNKYPDIVRKYFMRGFMPGTTGKFGALHESFFKGGIFLYIPKNVEIVIPFYYLIFLNSSMSGIMPHNMIIIDDDSKVTVSEVFSSSFPNQSGCLMNGITEIFVNSRSELNFISIEDWIGDVYHMNIYRGIVEESGTLRWMMNFIGGGLIKTNMETILSGVGSQTEMTGLYTGNNKQHIDLNSLMYHAAAKTKGDLLFKGVLRDHSRSVFTGMIKIDKGSAGCNSYLANHNLLLSDNARADSMPRLEIENNDVRASHGATIGQIDEDQVFYLMSRGIERKDAERMVVDAFFEPIIAKIPYDDLRTNLRKSLEMRLFPTESEVSDVRD